MTKKNENKKEKEKTCNYRFYLFNSTDFSEYLEITITPLKEQIIDFLKSVYPGVNIEKLTPNQRVFLLTSTFDSNVELTRKLIELYNQKYSSKKVGFEYFDKVNGTFDENCKKYRYTTLVECDRNAEDLSFMKFSNSTKTREYTNEKLVPIVYDSDFELIQIEDLRKADIFTFPRRVLMNIFPAELTKVNSSDNDLYMIVYNILSEKYKNKLPHVNEVALNINKDFDRQSVFNLLKSKVLTKCCYSENSSFYLDLLAKVILYNRISLDYRLSGKVYDSESSIINSSCLINYNIRSLSEKLGYRFNAGLVNEVKSNILTDGEYEQMLIQSLAEYNIQTNNSYTIDDLLSDQLLFNLVIGNPRTRQ